MAHVMFRTPVYRSWPARSVQWLPEAADPFVATTREGGGGVFYS